MNPSRHQNFNDKHHIFYEKHAWSSLPPAKQLRQTPELIPRIPRDLHNELHAMTSPVPLLGRAALMRTVKLFEPEPGDTLATIDNLAMAIEGSNKSPRASRIERQLANLAIESLMEQRPILQGNIISPTNREVRLVGDYKINHNERRAS